MMVEKQRYEWIDVAKGYGIIFVMWAHLINEGLNSWIYSFHMPLFFFLSGYVFHTRYNILDFIKRKIKTLIIPYFCVGFPMVLFEWLKYSMQGEPVNKAFWRLLKAFLIQNRYLTLWYIACLFCLNLIFYGLAKSIKNEWIPVLRYLGENSMLYYAWHQTIMIPIVQLMLSWFGWQVHGKDSWLELVLYKLVCVILILLITTACDYIIKKVKLQFILGKA